jgi:hypothetical protein
MAKPWDESMKALVRANPQAFVRWLIPAAKFIKEHREKLQGWDQEVDILLEVLADLQYYADRVKRNPQVALAVFDSPKKERILAYVSLLPLSELVILAPREDLASNAYVLNLERPGASRFVKQFQKCIEERRKTNADRLS